MSEETGNQPDTAHADVAIVCALPLEMAEFVRKLDRVKRYTGGSFTFRGGVLKDTRVVVVESGTGVTLAARATQAVIDAHTPNWVISAGFAGALQEEMRIGDLVIANEVANESGESLSVDMKMPEDRDRGLFVGRLMTAKQIVRTVDEKREISERTGALAVDLESFAVARVCGENKQKFLAIRVISDDMSADLPPEVLSVFGSTGSIRAGAVAGALWKRFSSAKDMWRLREQAADAAEKLAPFLEGVVKQLCPETS
ncbi:MAG: 5'-methylthioadenosine nucleosidase [Planctomycetota bacterium]|nr:MAG: 5'-methylthioadenosine nucleosidase [Planctomycetota bacterium]REK26756.1 MAG: 5'-methylthioadenosine nucleosidase [Planctomycetota bacterium]REK28317.1 MAG: 5'-methylthioadenosine nucleosidase [Planctomycetota bacterium]